MPHITLSRASGQATPRRWLTLWDAITSVTFPFNWVTNDSLPRQRSFFWPKSTSSPAYISMKDWWMMSVVNRLNLCWSWYLHDMNTLFGEWNYKDREIIYQSLRKQRTVEQTKYLTLASISWTCVSQLLWENIQTNVPMCVVFMTAE